MIETLFSWILVAKMVERREIERHRDQDRLYYIGLVWIFHARFAPANNISLDRTRTNKIKMGNKNETKKKKPKIFSLLTCLFACHLYNCATERSPSIEQFQFFKSGWFFVYSFIYYIHTKQSNKFLSLDWHWFQFVIDIDRVSASMDTLSNRASV